MKFMKVLLVEDDQHLAVSLSKQLKKTSFAVDQVHNLEEADFQLNEFGHEYDCLILDINLPDGTGFELCSRLRRRQVLTPIIIMTARGGVPDKIKGLNLGADDYVTKPVDFAELVARIRAVIRRNSKDPSPILQVGDLTIDPQTQRVSRKRQIELSAKEFAVLEFMARHSDEVVTRTMIMEHVWGSDFETFSNVIDVYIKNLRKKIDGGKKKKLIHTIRGSGYSLSNSR